MKFYRTQIFFFTSDGYVYRTKVHFVLFFSVIFYFICIHFIVIELLSLPISFIEEWILVMLVKDIFMVITEFIMQCQPVEIVLKLSLWYICEEMFDVYNPGQEKHSPTRLCALILAHSIHSSWQAGNVLIFIITFFLLPIIVSETSNILDICLLLE